MHAISRRAALSLRAPSRAALWTVGTPSACLLSSSSQGSVAARRLRSPVTWGSAALTLGGLYGLYEYQYRRQLMMQRTAGKPDLGGSFSLVQTDGTPMSDADLHGRWALLYFGFTKCPDICPEEMTKVSEVLTRLDGQGVPVQPVFITIDPHRDTKERLVSYFKDGDFHPKFIPLTGSHEEVKRACRAYRVYFSKPTEEEMKAGDYLLDHSIISYLVDPDGEFVEYFGKSLSANEMEERMRKVITDWENARWWAQVLPQFLQAAEPPRKPKTARA